MEKIYFNIWPDIENNINNLSTQYLILKIFLILFLALLLFLLIKILLIKYKINKVKELRNQILNNINNKHLEKLKNLEGKKFIKEFINYLENIKIKEEYKSIEDILSILNIHKQEIENIKNIVYKDQGNIKEAESSLKNLL